MIEPVQQRPLAHVSDADLERLITLVRKDQGFGLLTNGEAAEAREIYTRNRLRGEKTDGSP